MIILRTYYLFGSIFFADFLGRQEQLSMTIIPDITIALALGGMASLWSYMAFRYPKFSYLKLFALFIILLAGYSLIPILDIIFLHVPTSSIQVGVRIFTATIAILASREFLANSPKLFFQRSHLNLVRVNRAVKQELALCQQFESESNQNQQLLNNAFDYALIGQAILTPVGGWIRVNLSLCQILGYSEAEILRTNFTNITHPEDSAADRCYRDQLLSGEVSACRYEKRYFHKQGHIVWVLLSISLVRAPDDQPLYFIAQIDDISEHKQLEGSLNSVIERLKLAIEERSSELDRTYSNLQKSAAQYQDLYDNAPDMYLSIDFETFRILRCNQTLLKELGYNYAEIVGSSALDLCHPDFHSEAKKAFQTFSNKGEVKDIYLVVQRKDGTALDISLNARGFQDKQGNLQYSHSSWRDISERKRLENQLKQINTDLDERVQNRTWALQLAVQSLKESQSRLELALEVSGDGWWDWNIHTGDMSWSSQFYQMLGYEVEELPSSFESWHNLIHPDDLPRVMALLEDHLQDHFFPYVFDYQILTQSGQWKWISALGKVVAWNDQGDPLRIVGMHHDISDRKRAEQELKRINTELVRSNEELGHFAYVASHDLQEPLRKIGSFTDLLAERYQGQLDEKADRYIRYITDGADRMQGLIGDLLSYSRVGRAELTAKPTALSSLVEEVQSDLEKVIEQRHVEIITESLPTVVVDPVQMRRVFQNLIVNAMKYCQADIPSIHIRATQSHKFWTISVEDNGIGIDPQFAERIFVIFQRLHNREEYSGTGIGLAICKKIVERHGGQIWVGSGKDQGAIFSFTLPV